MAKNNRKLKVINYPDEREGRIKDANRKLRSDLKKERNKVKKLKQDIASLQRAFNKSCEYISEKLAEKGFEKVEDVIELVNNSEYKETERGRLREKEKLKQEKTKITLKKCPKCGLVEGKGYSVFEHTTFSVLTCKCGFRTKAIKSERDKGS